MKAALPVWGALWALVGTPWRSFHPYPSLARAEWIPSIDFSTRSQVLNVLAFVPFGFIAARMGWRPRTVVLVAGCISVSTELLQLFSTRRYPSTADVILNVVGTIIGIAIAWGWQRAHDTWSARSPSSSES